MKSPEPLESRFCPVFWKRCGRPHGTFPGGTVFQSSLDLTMKSLASEIMLRKSQEQGVYIFNAWNNPWKAAEENTNR